MSSVDPLSQAGAAPVVNEAFEPQSVRDGSAATKQAYAEALDFESLLVNRLAQQLAQSSGFGGSDASGSNASSANGELASLLPGALTSSIMSDGGLGIAAALLPSFESHAATTPATATQVSPATTTGAAS